MRWLNSKDKKIKRWHPFLRELSAVEVIGNYIFAHAGIDTNKPLNKQIKEYTTDIIHIRLIVRFLKINI